MNEPEVRVTLPPEAESVWSIFIQKMGQNMAEVKNLNDKLPPCLRQTNLFSYGQPLALVTGDGDTQRARPWIRH